MNKKRKIKVLYIFAGQRKKMEREWKSGLMPDTYFIGLNHLKDFGIEAEYIENKLVNRLRSFNFNLANIFLIFKARQYDCVFIGASIFFVFLAKVVFRFSKPKFAYYNTSLTNLYKRNNQGLRRWIVRKTIKSLDAVVCPSTAQRDFLVDQGFDSKKIYFIANGVDVDFISSKSKILKNKQSEKYILSVGRDMGRDYKTLIEAVKGMDIKLKIVAADRNMEKIAELPPNVSFQTLPFIDLLKLYSNCRLVIIPTWKENHLNASDCSGQYVLLDSMASSKAVIASNREALKDYFIDGENGVVVEPENPLELRKAIEELLADEHLTKTMGERSFIAVNDKFTTRKFANKLSKIFFKLIDSDS